LHPAGAQQKDSVLREKGLFGPKPKKKNKKKKNGQVRLAQVTQRAVSYTGMPVF